MSRQNDHVNLAPVVAKIEDQLEQAVSQCTAVQSLLSLPDSKKFRNVLALDPPYRDDHLTLTTLAGDGKISVSPYVFASENAGQLLAFYHLGPKVAGHPTICHGGLPAVLLDECMGRACFPKLANRIGVTAKLELNYRAPIPVGSIILIKARTNKVEGRKAWAEATVEDPWKNTVFIEANALYIEPKGAAEMPKVI